MNNEKHGQRTHSTKMGADSPAENTQNASKNFSQKCLPMPKIFEISSLWVSVVREPQHPIHLMMILRRRMH